jgi:hypothetical protein
MDERHHGRASRALIAAIILATLLGLVVLATPLLQRYRRNSFLFMELNRLNGTAESEPWCPDSVCDAAAAVGLGRFVRTLADVTSVSLYHEDVHDNDLACLNGLPELQELELAWTSISDEGLRMFAGTDRLRTLVLTGTPVGQGLSYFRRNIALESLILGSTGLTDRDARALESFPQLRLLSCGHEKMGDTAMLYIAKLAQLQRLTLVAIPITDEGMRHIARLKHLDQLSIAECAVTDASLPAIASVESLRELDIHGTLLTSAWIVYLKSLENLVRLIVGIEQLDGITGDELDGLPALTELIVRIPESGADEGIAICEALRHTARGLRIINIVGRE